MLRARVATRRPTSAPVRRTPPAQPAAV